MRQQIRIYLRKSMFWNVDVYCGQKRARVSNIRTLGQAMEAGRKTLFEFIRDHERGDVSAVRRGFPSYKRKKVGSGVDLREEEDGADIGGAGS